MAGARFASGCAALALSFYKFAEKKVGGVVGAGDFVSNFFPGSVLIRLERITKVATYLKRPAIY